MFLKSLQIQGFKSFPDKVKLEFKQGITCTVGPNGSGKSNISDAVRWVLGEQSPNALRIKSMEDVVFAGTETRKAAGFAEVVLVIDNTGRWLSPDTDEVSICRRYYRSGNSEYKINGKNVLLRELNELFMDTGIGRDGYSMIGQGKISDIVDARAHDRRVIFEEAAGISKYRSRRNETEKNLAKTQDNLTHLEVILSGLEERIGPLERESEKAKKYLALQTEFQKAEIGLWLLVLNNSTDKLRDMDYNITLMEHQRSELDAKAEQLEAEAEALGEQSNALNADKDDCSRKSSAMEEQAAVLEGEAAVVENDISHERSDIARIRDELTRSAGMVDELRESIQRKQSEAHAHSLLVIQQKRCTESYKQRIEALRSDESGRNDALDKLYKQKNELTVKLNECSLTAASTGSQLAETNERAGMLTRSIAEKRQSIDRMTAEKQETEESLRLVTERLDSAGNTVNGYTMRLNKQQSNAEAIKRSIEAMRLDASDKERHARTIETLEKNMEGYDYSVRRVIQRFESGGLKGIHGPVSRVISVEDEYAVAVETALGAAVKNIIVETAGDGKQAMEFLKQTKGGRATFLPIDVIEPRRLDEPGLSDCRGFVSIASKLIDCETKYRNIIENLLGRVCVCEDMDCAIAIGRRFRNRFKIVTLDGQVINAGGAMTGGSQDKNIGLISRKGELERLKAQAAQIRADADKAQEQYDELCKRISADRAALLSAQSEQTCLNEDRVRFESGIRSLAGQLDAAKKELDRMTAESDGIEGHVAELEAQRSSAVASGEKYSRLLEELSARIDADAGDIDRMSGERDRLSEQFNQAGMKLLSLQMELEAIERQLSEMKQQLEGGGDKDGVLSAEIAEKERHIEELLQKSTELRSKAAELRRSAQETRAGIKDIEAKRGELERLAREKRKEAKETSEQRESVSSQKGRLEERYEQSRREQDTIILRLMEDYKLTRREAQAQYDAAENEDAAKRLVGSLKSKIRALGDVHVGAIEEYREVSEKYTIFKTQIDDVLKSKAEMETLIADLTKTMQEMFLDTFAKINANFGEIFPELFGGGTAGMTLVDAEDCLNCGIDINITQPSKTKGSSLSMSGGEKSIVAVAIYFAIMKVKPSPFCFLDEIDSALDEHNVVNIANYIKRFVATTQYIVITHRRGMMEAASMLYGVTKQKQDGISKLIELRLDEAEERLGKLD